MARLIYTARALNDLEQVTEFLLENNVDAAVVLEIIEEAVLVLRRHPHIGRLVEAGMRELMISHGRTGYVALYSVEALNDTVLILSIRHQREAGLSRNGPS